MIIQLARLINCNFYQRSLSTAAPFTSIWIQKRTLLSKQGNNDFSPRPAQGILNTSNTSFKELSISISQRVKQEISVFKNVDFTQLKESPFPAIVYGFAGIIPFVFPPLYFITSCYSPLLATYQLVYGATILAFVGGVKWGNAMAKDDVSHYQIGISTIPSLVAWSSLLVPEPLGFVVVSSGLLGALYIDLISSRYPPWFCALRTTLTGIGITSLITTLFFYVFH